MWMENCWGVVGENVLVKLYFFENIFVWIGFEFGRSISTVCLNSGV